MALDFSELNPEDPDSQKDIPDTQLEENSLSEKEEESSLSEQDDTELLPEDIDTQEEKVLADSETETLEEPETFSTEKENSNQEDFYSRKKEDKEEGLELEDSFPEEDGDFDDPPSEDSIILGLQSGLIFVDQENKDADPSFPNTSFDLFGRHVNLKFELVLNGEEDAVEPFAVLGRGRYSKVLLGRVVTSEGQILRHLAIKIQADHYDFLEDRPVDRNPAINLLWEDEYQNLKKLSKENKQSHEDNKGATEFVSLVEVFEGEENQPKTFPSTTFCMKTHLFFHTICPHCASPLETCQDEQILNGARSWRDSAIRYLYCPSCYSGGREIFLYLKEEDVLEENRENSFFAQSFETETKEKSSLLNNSYQRMSDYGYLEPVTNQEEGQYIVSEKDMYEAYRYLLEQNIPCHFPCKDCGYKEECYSKETPLVHERLTPLSFYDFYAIPLELLHFSLEDFSMLLGKYSWEKFEEDKYKSFLSSNLHGCNEVLKLTRPSFQNSKLFHYQLDRTGKESIEIFSLKLALFLQICRGVYKIHKFLQRPHLDLKPENIFVKIPPVNLDRPALRDFRAKVIDLACTTKRDNQVPSELNQKIWTKPWNIADSFSSQHLRDGKYGDFSSGLTVRIVEIDLDKEEACLVLSGSSIDPQKYTSDDLFLLILDRVGVKGEIWCHKELNSTDENELCLRSIKIDKSSLEQLEKKKEFGDLKPVGARIYQSFGIPEDIHALGKIFLYILVKSDNFPSLIACLENCISQVEDISSAEEKIDLLKLEFRKQWKKLGPKNIYWLPEEVSKNSINEAIWEDTLLLIARMITYVPGFSICETHSDYSDHAPELRLQEVIEQLEGISRKVDIELFGKASVRELVIKFLSEVQVVEENDSSSQQKIEAIYQILLHHNKREESEILKNMKEEVSLELTQKQIREIKRNFLFEVEEEMSISQIQEKEKEQSTPYREKIIEEFRKSSSNDQVVNSIRAMLSGLKELQQSIVSWQQKTFDDIQGKKPEEVVEEVSPEDLLSPPSETDTIQNEEDRLSEVVSKPDKEIKSISEVQEKIDFEQLFIKSIYENDVEDLEVAFSSLQEFFDESSTDYSILKSWVEMLEPKELKKHSVGLGWLFDKIYTPVYQAGLQAYEQERSSRKPNHTKEEQG